MVKIFTDPSLEVIDAPHLETESQAASSSEQANDLPYNHNLESLIFNTIKPIYSNILSTIPNLVPSFERISLKELLSFAKILSGSDRAGGPKFHELTGTEVLLRLETVEMIELIDSLLTKNANSDGISLYSWYLTAKPLDENFHQEFLNRQRSKFEKNDFGANCDHNFLWDLLANPTIAKNSQVQFLLNNLTNIEFQNLVIDLVISLGTNPLAISSYSNSHQFRHGTDDIHRNLLLMLRSHPEKVELILRTKTIEDQPAFGATLGAVSAQSFAKLLINNSTVHISSVINYYRSTFPQPDPSGGGTLFITNLISSSTYIRNMIMQALHPEEITSLLDSGKISQAIIFESLPLGKLPYAVIGKYLHGNSIVDKRYNVQKNQWENVNNNDLLRSIKAGDFADLARDLVCYRAIKNTNPDQQFSFFGIKIGFGKNDKFAVVDKILTFIYGTESEKQAAGRFTDRELQVMNQGNLGAVIRNHNTSISRIISLPLSMKPVSDVDASVAASSSM